MNHRTKQLIIIPGIGDRTWLYKPLALLWRRFNTATTVYNYGWNQPNSNKVCLQRLEAYISQYEEVYLVGISAGGTAAINSLYLHPNKIKGVITICTPYSPLPISNPTLNDSITRLNKLGTIRHNIRRRIISIYSNYDLKVPPQYALRKELQQITVNIPGHGLSIFITLIVNVPRLIKLHFKL